ncbi:hypothetical protein IGI04_008500 [Brassica rapa subsp. trilocularis]|uniref:TCP domain-containing protein n=2 Tax=Brassica TaxID=3705 RepID=A0ABQ8EF30_BRANA|nr:hypothetical protein IGI04_008500 [Brassica rapa subsp. trilocularis]KAH0940209.1 hypothetical protein HID58_007670 [Brassica napus]
MRARYCEEDEIQANQERDHNHQLNLNSMFQPQNQPSSVPTSRQWTSAFRNPRIVRVSRTFGGKDRHSKVCTVRGLRDRRIRLSVPTAIQVYDLQDRLGLSQPSKVIDWLLEAAKYDVDELPPLQFPQGTRTRIADTTTTPRESFDLDKGKWIKQDENSNHQDHGFDTSHQNFSLTNPYNNSNASSYYNLGHLQNSLDQSGNNVTVAIPNVPYNNNLNLPPPPTMSSLFPMYPSFLGASHHVVDGAGNLQLFSSNANRNNR